MNYKMTFTVEGSPQGKRRPRFTTVNGYARAYEHDSDALYENQIKLTFQNARPNDYDLYEKALSVRITALFDIPKAFSKVKTQRALRGEIRPVKKPDSDNIAKVVCDALNGIAYKDDTQIVELIVIKTYALRPAVIVTIEEV